MRVTVTFDQYGNIQHVRRPDLEFLQTLGTTQYIRASHIVPVNRWVRWLFRFLRSVCTDHSLLAEFTRRWPCRWQADLSRCGGPVLGPYLRRSDAITAEVAWIETRVLGR